MNIQIKHSIIQDESVLKFYSLKDYFRCLQFLDETDLKYTPLTYSSKKDSASIRVNEVVLTIITNKYRIYKCQV